MKSVSKNKGEGSGFKLIPMKKVLIALDYDPSSQKVAEKGYSLAKAMNSEVTLLHVLADPNYYSALEYSPITGYSGFSNLGFLQMANVDGLMKASYFFLDKIKNHLHDEKIQTIVEQGDSAEVILKTAKHLHADFIIMGSHSRRWLEQIMVGSVTEKVLHHTLIPLFIVPVKEHKS
jgi:nucleotide-binding universal stress UspA family protein